MQFLKHSVCLLVLHFYYVVYAFAAVSPELMLVMLCFATSCMFVIAFLSLIPFRRRRQHHLHRRRCHHRCSQFGSKYLARINFLGVQLSTSKLFRLARLFRLVSARLFRLDSAVAEHDGCSRAAPRAHCDKRVRARRHPRPGQRRHLCGSASVRGAADKHRPCSSSRRRSPTATESWRRGHRARSFAYAGDCGWAVGCCPKRIHVPHH